MALAREDIIEAALALLNEGGLEGVSTRKLALALRVQGPALYHHFASKQELLGRMANRLVSRALTELDPAVSWDMWLRESSASIRRMVMRYRDGARLLTAAWPDDDMRHITIPTLAAPLQRSGFSTGDAHEAIVIVSSFTIGWVMNEQNESIAALMRTQMDIDEAFGRALETIIGGLRLRL